MQRFSLDKFNNTKAFVEFLNDMSKIYDNIEKYKPNIGLKILIVFDISSDIISNKKRNPTVPEFFIRGRKLNISLAFFTQYYFIVPRNIKVKSTHYFITKIPNKRELQQPKYVEK